MAHKPVGSGSSVAITSGTSTRSSAFSVQADTVRVVAVSGAAFVAIGTEPTATASDYYVLAGSESTLALTPASQRVSGIITGTTTQIDFPEGTGCPFEVGDYVTLTSSNQTYYNFTHQPVIAINSSSNKGGYYSTRVSIGTDTSGIITAFSSNSNGELRKSLKIATYGSGTGTLYFQQVQTSGQA